MIEIFEETIEFTNHLGYLWGWVVFLSLSAPYIESHHGPRLGMYVMQFYVEYIYTVCPVYTYITEY